LNFLLDTNVLSEWTRPEPHPGVVRWLAEADEDRLHLSVVTIAELRFGIARLPQSQRRERLDDWLRQELPQRFEGRVLPIGPAIADVWGRIVAQGRLAGRPIGPMDAFIAATAQARGLTLATRNIADFAHVLSDVFNPWVGA